MPAPNYVLSESFTLFDVFSAAQVECGEVDRDSVERATLLRAMKITMLELPSLGGGWLKPHWVHPLVLTISTDSIDLNGYNVRDVMGVSDADTNTPDGDDGSYTLVSTWEGWQKRRRNAESNKWGRFYFLTLGQKKILLLHGYSTTPSAFASVLVERTPYVRYDLDTVDARTEKIDVMDFMVPFVIAGTAFKGLQMAGVKKGLDRVESNYKEVLAGLTQTNLADKERLRQQNRDQ